MFNNKHQKDILISVYPKNPIVNIYNSVLKYNIEYRTKNKLYNFL